MPPRTPHCTGPELATRRHALYALTHIPEIRHIEIDLGSADGARLVPRALRASPRSWRLAWSTSARTGCLQAFGVEGTGSYGIGLARFLRRHGHTVQEVHRPPGKGERRLSGKSDTIDAEHAARQVLAGRTTAVPKTADSATESRRLLKTSSALAHSATCPATLVAGCVGMPRRSGRRPTPTMALTTAGRPLPRPQVPAPVSRRTEAAGATARGRQIGSGTAPGAAEQ